MIKKIIYISLSLAIVIAGVIGFNRLNYWDRSARIFSINEGQQFEHGFGRHGGQFEGRNRDGGNRQFERPFSRDSLHQNFNPPERQFFEKDSTRQRFGRGNFPGERNDFHNNENFKRGGRGGHFHGGSKVQLGNVGWFLAVFAMFTVITIYLDKFNKRIKSQKR